MKTLLFTILCLTSGMVSGQSIYKIIKQIDREERKGDSIAALNLGLRTDNLYKDNDEIFSLDRALLKKRIGSLYYSTGNNADAEKYFSAAIELFQEDYGIDELEYVMALNEYSMLLIDEDRHDEADSLLLEAIQFQEDSDLNNTPVYMLTLYLQGLLHESRGNFVEAEAKLEQATAMKKPILPAYRRIHSEAFILLAAVYAEREKYSDAINIYKNGLKSFRKKSSEYSYWLSELADIYTQINQFETAKPLYLQVLETERSYGRNKTAEYADYLNQLGALYWKSGDYDKSLKLHQEALQLQKSGAYDTSDTYFNLAALYTLQADFASAEEALGKMITKEEMEEKNGFNYNSYLNLMGNLYTLTGNYGKAEKYYTEVIDKTRELYGNEHSTDYAVNIDNLAHLYLKMDKDEMAKPLIINALEIKKKIYGDTHSDIAYSLRSLSEISIIEKNYQEAENYLSEVLRITEECLGEDHSDYGNALHDLAILNLEIKNYAEAEKLLRKCTFILRNINGENHPNYNSALATFAYLYDETGRLDSAELLYLGVNENLHYQIKRNFSYLSEKEKEHYISTLSTDFSDFNDFVSERKSVNPIITGVAWNNLMALKGIVLVSSRAIRQAIMNSGDETLIGLYEDLNSARRLQIEQEKLPVGQQWFNIDSLDRTSVVKEKDLSNKLKSLPGFTDFTGLENSITWREVQDKLIDNEAAIEFFSIEKDTVTYYALVLRQGMEFPEMVKLFYETDLKNFIKNNKAGNDAATADRLYNFFANSSTDGNLFEIIWEPLESNLNGIETIYYSPSGILNQIAFDAIPLKDGKYLSDRYKLVKLLSTRDILNNPEERLLSSIDKKAVFYGGINYDTDASKLQASGKKYPQRQISGKTLLSDESSRGSGFMYLDGTLTEVQKIETLLSKRNITSVILSGDDATEESFKSLDNLNSPVCLHIATHGFFFPQINGSTGSRAVSGQDTYRYSDNPLLRSGLIFAGGNNMWKNGVIPPNTEDGILLASEVSEMYLPNTRLVVLSACETGLGDLKGAEGVYGLQRSFKMAGAKYMIISLWQVPDYQTSELMNKFYENWISEKGIHDSFREAQSYMKLKYPSMPSVWAAFVLVE